MAIPIEGRASHSLCRLLTASLAIALAVLSCQEQSEASGGETHFLTHCDGPSASCGDELSCLSNVCTLRCDSLDACRAFPGAECVPGSESGSPSYCDVRCSVDADCATLSDAHRCNGGACRAGSDTLECPTGELEANQVLLIGDTFFATSHQITAFLEDLARNDGALSAGERYRDNSSLVVNGLAVGGLREQFAAGVSEGDVRLVIMNGGGADVLLGSCETPATDCPDLTAAAASARELLDSMGADGVLNVVYAFYPDPLDATVRDKMDALRPLIQDACESSSTPCHWLDLRPVFAGRYDEYILPDGLNPTAAGSEATAQAIWELLRLNCIAQ
jgi:hypothetical protein